MELQIKSSISSSDKQERTSHVQAGKGKNYSELDPTSCVLSALLKSERKFSLFCFPLNRTSKCSQMNLKRVGPVKTSAELRRQEEARVVS
jgi:hypothetical protein